MDDLLVKYLLEEADAAEQQEVIAWCNHSRENKRYFEQFKIIWEQSRQLAVTSTINEEDAWLRFKQGLNKDQSSPSVIIPMPARKLPWLKIAATLFFVITGAATIYLYIQKQQNNSPVFVQSLERVITDTLPDGSIVTLNKHSSLSYTRKFTGNTRDITLTGEAFFNVTPDKNKPFIITANEVTVKVVGTSFNVKSEGNKTEVIVETGIVEVAKQQKAIRLKPHEKVVIEQSQQGLYKEANTDKLYDYYKTNVLKCDATPLWRVVEILNEAYGGKRLVIANKSIFNMPLTTTLPANSLETAVTIVQKTLNITAEKNGDQFLLK